MGNSVGGRRKKAKVMKIDGEVIKLKTPVQAGDVVKDYPGYVLLDAEAVKHFGIRAKPLEPQQQLKPKKTYFLVELPKCLEEKVTTRRVRSGIHLSAKDRLECLMLSRRAVSDLSAVVTSTSHAGGGSAETEAGRMRVKMRLPRAQVEKLVDESRDNREVAEKIISLYMGQSGDAAEDGAQRPEEEWKPGLGGVRENLKARERRVSFVPQEAQIQVCSQ